MRPLSSTVRETLRYAAALAIAGSLLFLTTAPALAVGGVSGSIQGVVTDQATKLPLAGVAISATSPVESRTTKTDAKGFFSFPSLPVDTYTVSFQLTGYQPVTQSGLTVQGDQTITADSTLEKALRTIARATVRTPTSAYQPRQTTDSYQVSGAQLNTALGKKFAISQTQLQSSVPGIQQTVYGSSSIRGSTRTELAYQFEGVNYTEPLSNQFTNSLGLNGTAALQVNPGAGDATQGNAGAGAINLIAKRGSRPAFGTLDLEVTNYPFVHQGAFEYGWATPNGRFSNYTAVLAQNQNRIYGIFGQPAVLQGTFFSVSSVTTRDVINNSVFKFGRNNQNSLQFVYQTRYSDFFFNNGGFSQLCYKTCDPSFVSRLATAGNLPLVPAANRTAVFQSIIGLLPGQSSAVQNLYYPGFNHQPVDFLKLQYTSNLNDSTVWTNRLYRVVSSTRFDRPYDSQSFTSRVTDAQGGNRTGLNGELIKQFGERNLVTLAYVYEGNDGIYSRTENLSSFRSLLPGLGSLGREVQDFIPAASCIPPPPGEGGCGYLAQFFGGNIPRIPHLLPLGPDYQQSYGFGLRDQITVNPKLRLDIGLRVDGTNFRMRNKENTPYTFGDDVLKPMVFQPRFAFAYQVSPRDAVRASYGRSVQFTPGGIINSPIAFPEAFRNVPSYDNQLGPFNPANPAATAATFCGPKNTSVCTSYGQQLHDEFVNTTQGPEAFAVKPATFNNYDFSYSHQFKNNVGLKVTPFFKRGYDINVFAQPAIGTDPVTGLAIFGPPALSNQGIDKSTGVEFLLTKEADVGLSGFFNLTYVNRLQNIPPGYLGQTEDFYPSTSPQALALGTLYRAGYLSPLTGRLGVTYRTRNGFRINPIVSYDKGFPIGSGTLVPVFVNGVATVVPNTNISLPGFGTISNTGSSSGVSQYVDPVNPGSAFKPNIAATRGTPETSLAGGVLSKARFSTDLSLEYSPNNSRTTLGIYISNLFNQLYSEPATNPRYQPVATGIAGPQTGQTSAAVTFGPALGYANFGPERFGQSAYVLSPTNAPINFRFYYQLSL